MIERSLGHPDAFPILESRDSLQRISTTEHPGSAAVRRFRPPRLAMRFFLFLGASVKLDGTYGGEGVSVVRSKDEAAAAFRQAGKEASVLIAAKRALVNRDPYAFWTWRRKERSRVTMQEYIVGSPANIMVACWQGQVLAQVSVEALSCQGATGAANIVRRIERPDFEQPAASRRAS